METNEAEALELEEIEEPPPTDPCPGAPLPRLDPPEDDLEKRLAWLAAEVRSTSAEHAKKKRNESVLEAREYKTAAIPASTKTPHDVDLPKVTLAVGVDPHRDPTLVGRRTSDNEWDFDVSDPEELSRTLPPDPQALNADPLPFQTPANAAQPPPKRKFTVVAASVMGILLGTFLHHAVMNSVHSEYDTITPARYGLSIVAHRAQERYDDWLTLNALAAQKNAAPAEPQVQIITAPPLTSASSSRLFPYVKPRSTGPSKTPMAPGSPHTTSLKSDLLFND